MIGTASCAQLNNNYLPPAGAAAAGGSGPGLQAPKGGGSFAGANVPFQPPRAGPGQGPAPVRPGASPSRPGAAPAAPSGPPIEIISYENVNNGDGTYKWRLKALSFSKAFY